MPNWFLELNWYNQDPELIKNPLPFPLKMLKSEPKLRSKFCIFVASNPNCIHRNTLYHTISRYKTIDSAGSLFNNVKQIPGGPGGTGGQKEKIEAYKNYKFVLVCENSETPGYVTEKLLHAKLAGCVPIYWGDPDVALEFNKDSFIDVHNYGTIDKLLTRISELDRDSTKWLAMAKIPLLSDEAVQKAKDTITNFTRIAMKIKIINNNNNNKPISNVEKIAQINNNPIKNSGPNNSNSNGKIEPYSITPIKDANAQVIVTCCNSKFVDSAIQLIKSSPVPVYIWVWDVDFMDIKKLTKAGAKMVIPFNTKWNPQWSDFWNPAHYAWKSLVMMIANSSLPPGTEALYLDSGIEIVGDLNNIWKNIKQDGYFVSNMPEHKMRTWCHPTFCSLLNLTNDELDAPQISANVIGFVAGNEKMTAVFNQTLSAACNPNIITGHKWYKYSDTCIGHRHDQSILSLMCIRNGIVMKLHDSFAGWKSRNETIQSGCVLYVHRGQINNNVVSTSLKNNNVISTSLKNIDESFVVNLIHRGDRLEKFWENQPYLKGFCKRLNAVNGRDIILTNEICNLFKNNDFKWKKSVMGCALSHYEMWKQISKENKTVLILEDDALLIPDFVSKWNSIADSMPKDTDFVFLGGVLPPNKPGLSMITEPVNSSFARVKVNSMFGSQRRYFHFCTYSYIITSSGAKKMCNLINDRGIFTSADHMIVNHMNIFNIYFTTPLLGGCIQDNDPIYQNADFNNFNRIDKFDSEIWNNTETFSNEEILAVKKYPPLIMVYFKEKEIKEAINSEWLNEIFQREFVWVSSSENIKPGSTVLLNYIQHTPGYIIEGWINRNIDCKIFILHGDETCKGDVSMYKHPAVRTVFRNYWRPDCVSSKVIHLPLGYLNGKSGDGTGIIASQRPFTWSFAGAIDRNNRKDIIKILQERFPNNKVHLTPTWGTSANLIATEYMDILRKSKFIPCLDGFFNTESFRFYEALEAGAIPIVCIDDKESYKNILKDAPLLILNNWYDNIDFDWDNKQKELLEWWINYKQRLIKIISNVLQ